ncbi:MAG: hypothetical protein NTV05_05040 [Acidobacteria bacterium]|nr:hypothetical protein [Acidobacteriota bacterium]
MDNPLGALLLLLGVGFLAANLILLNDYLAYRRRRHDALLTWAPPRPGTFVLSKWIAVGLGLVILYKLLVLHWLLGQVFGEVMMFVYYGVVYPLSFRVERGFYRDGLRLERRFVKYSDITGLTWREDRAPALVVVAGHQQRAGRLVVPPEHYGEARRLLRDHIRAHHLHIQRPPLDLGGHDEREDV